MTPQEKVLSVETAPSEDGLSVETWYLVRYKCPQNGIFEAPLPRKEVRADLLAEFEKGALPKKRDHGNLRSQFRWLKSARMAYGSSSCFETCWAMQARAPWKGQQEGGRPKASRRMAVAGVCRIPPRQCKIYKCH